MDKSKEKKSPRGFGIFSCLGGSCLMGFGLREEEEEVSSADDEK